MYIVQVYTYVDDFLERSSLYFYRCELICCLLKNVLKICTILTKIFFAKSDSIYVRPEKYLFTICLCLLILLLCVIFVDICRTGAGGKWKALSFEN